MKKAKFEVGQHIYLSSPKMSGEGVIEAIESEFLEVDEHGGFNHSGLMTLERSISSISLPYSFDGETLKVEYPEHDYGSWVQKAKTRVSKFYGYHYSVRMDENKYLLGVSESQVRAIIKPSAM